MMSVPTTARNVGGSGNLGFGFNYTNWAQRNNRIVVGGSQHWRFGFNYTNWAFQNGPFFQNDTLGKFGDNIVIFQNVADTCHCLY